MQNGAVARPIRRSFHLDNISQAGNPDCRTPHSNLLGTASNTLVRADAIGGIHEIDLESFIVVHESHYIAYGVVRTKSRRSEVRSDARDFLAVGRRSPHQKIEIQRCDGSSVNCRRGIADQHGIELVPLNRDGDSRENGCCVH